MNPVKQFLRALLSACPVEFCYADPNGDSTGAPCLPRGIAPQEHPKGFNWGLPRGILLRRPQRGFNRGYFIKRQRPGSAKLQRRRLLKALGPLLERSAPFLGPPGPAQLNFS